MQINPSIHHQIISMKKATFFVTIILIAGLCQLSAQTGVPKGYSNGVLTLAGGQIETGYIKESIRGNASVVIITTDGKKKIYNGNDLTAATIDSNRFVCIKGDFFRVVCEGEIYFLQKSSNAAGKAMYNGTEAIFINGTEGKINDYFFYDKTQQQLKLLTKKNVNDMITGTFNDCPAAIAKAKENGTDMATLRQAVELYNNREK